MYYVYILQSKTEKLYIGYSSDLTARMKAHKSHQVATTKNGSYELIYYEAYRNKADAVGREVFLKSGSGRRYINKQLAHHFQENMPIAD